MSSGALEYRTTSCLLFLAETSRILDMISIRAKYIMMWYKNTCVDTWPVVLLCQGCSSFVFRTESAIAQSGLDGHMVKIMRTLCDKSLRVWMGCYGLYSAIQSLWVKEGVFYCRRSSFRMLQCGESLISYNLVLCFSVHT